MKKKIALFGSGLGTNARNIIERLGDVYEFILVSNNPIYGFLNIAEDFELDLVGVKKKTLRELILPNVDLIVLAGFLLKLPEEFIQNNAPIINIHPSLLPKYGGEGMWGDHVHRSVLENCEKESGITIHYVNRYYDDGEIIFQTSCEIVEGETVDSLRTKIRQLELEYLPSVIVDLMDQMETLKSDS